LVEDGSGRVVGWGELERAYAIFIQAFWISIAATGLMLIGGLAGPLSLIILPGLAMSIIWLWRGRKATLRTESTIRAENRLIAGDPRYPHYRHLESISRSASAAMAIMVAVAALLSLILFSMLSAIFSSFAAIDLNSSPTPDAFAGSFQILSTIRLIMPPLILLAFILFIGLIACLISFGRRLKKGKTEFDVADRA
jgi:hypothetical protein